LKHVNHVAPCTGAVYGLGFVGAMIYFFQHADSLWEGVMGFFKAMVWPAFFVHKAFELMKF